MSRSRGRLSGEPADSKYKVFDLGVKGRALRHLTVEPPTQRLVLAAVNRTESGTRGLEGREKEEEEVNS